jgi:hypothetical protein
MFYFQSSDILTSSPRNSTVMEKVKLYIVAETPRKYREHNTIIEN